MSTGFNPVEAANPAEARTAVERPDETFRRRRERRTVRSACLPTQRGESAKPLAARAGKDCEKHPDESVLCTMVPVDVALRATRPSPS